MAAHNELGKQGEYLARLFLLKKGYDILETNWTVGKAEVDVIARKRGVIIFVEVKTRQNNVFGYPEESVTAKKEKLMMEAAVFYTRDIGHEGAIRFDIVAITIEPDMEIRHFRDAFFPTWNG